MNRRHLSGALISLAVVLSACIGVGPASPPATSSASTDPSQSAVSGTPVEVASLSAEPSAEPSGESLPAFSCSFPVIGDGTVPRAQVADVRVGTHDGYDRIVFEFANGLPELEVARATPPLLADGSGMELAIEGDAFLQVTLRGGTKQTEAGNSSYDGPRELSPGFDSLVELEEGGDFEAVSTWYAGLSSESCVRGFTLNDPPRIVIDIEH